MKINSVCIVISILACFVIGQERFVKPVDEAAKDASFLAFRTKLIAAAERKDSKFILTMLDPGIELSFGGAKGIADFKRIWKINSPRSEFWREFLAVVKNGGSFTGEGRSRFSSFSAPYTFLSWPDDIDIYEHQAIFGSNVNLRDQPSSEGNVKTQLSYNVVKTDYDRSPKTKDSTENEPVYEWLNVTTLGGVSGYVKPAFVRSPIDYRAGFEKKRGVWKMVFLISGD